MEKITDTVRRETVADALARTLSELGYVARPTASGKMVAQAEDGTFIKVGVIVPKATGRDGEPFPGFALADEWQAKLEVAAAKKAEREAKSKAKQAERAAKEAAKAKA